MYLCLVVARPVCVLKLVLRVLLYASIVICKCVTRTTKESKMTWCDCARTVQSGTGEGSGEKAALERNRKPPIEGADCSIHEQWQSERLGLGISV